MNTLNAAWVVFRKEVVDAFRDRRTLLVVFLSALLVGPLWLVTFSTIISNIENKREQRELVAVGADHAPTLVNFVQRQAWTIKPAPKNYEALLRDSKLSDAVLVIPADFEAELAQGNQPELQIVRDSSNRQSEVSAHKVTELLRGMAQERAGLTLVLRAVSPQLLSPFKLQDVDLASQQARAAQFTGMLGFFVLMAVMSGTLNAALDTTAGERERGSLEPLLMNPVSTVALALGKWGAVALVGMVVAVCSCLSFVPGQWLLRSESLQAMFQFGAPEIVGILGVLLPLACALAAALMAVSIRSKTLKEAQANTSVVMMAVTMVPLVSVFNDSGDQPWHLWVPVLAQNQIMMHVVKGDAISLAQVLIPAGLCVVVAAVALRFVASHLRVAAVK